MEHPDEGAIHAWLDGALSRSDSDVIRQHVEQCADCADAVAEARGLIAASSRIVAALDDVPANVLPMAKPMKSRRHAWYGVTGVAAAAALLLVAGNRWLANSEPREQPLSSIASAPAASAPATSPPLAVGAAPAPRPRPPLPLPRWRSECALSPRRLRGAPTAPLEWPFPPSPPPIPTSLHPNPMPPPKSAHRLLQNEPGRTRRKQLLLKRPQSLDARKRIPRLR